MYLRQIIFFLISMPLKSVISSYTIIQNDRINVFLFGYIIITVYICIVEETIE